MGRVVGVMLDDLADLTVSEVTGLADLEAVGELEPLKPVPKVSWTEELRVRQLLWDLENEILEAQLIASAAALASAR